MFEFLFKYPFSVYARGRFVFLSPWPRALLIVIAVLAALAFAFLLLRRGGASFRRLALWGLQWTTVLVLLLMLWQPAISVTTLKPQQNVVAVLVDDSRSMALADGGSPRLDQARSLLAANVLRDLQSRFQVRLYRVGDGLTRTGDIAALKAEEASSQLDGALRSLAAEAGALPIGAAVLLSDGADSTGGISSDTMNALRSRKLPVSTVGFGAPKLQHDVELSSLTLPQRTLADSRIQAEFKIQQDSFTGKKAKLVVSSAGKTIGAREITLRDVPEQVEPVEFHGGAPGVRAIEGRIEPLTDESNRDNNARSAIVSVESGKRRVLYVEGEPRWDYKFIRRALDDDTAISVASMLRTTQNKIYRQGIANERELVDGFPSKPEELFKYDAIVIGSIEATYFNANQQGMLERFVDQRGGGLLFLGGRSSLADGGYANSALAPLLPVVVPNHTRTFARAFVPAELTEAGKASLLCRIEESAEKSNEHWQILPYLANFQNPGMPKPGATVLARVNNGGTRIPLLVTENYGRGRTAVFATGGSWRWRMQQPVSDKSQETFWRQLLRWTVSGSPGPVSATVAGLSMIGATLQDSGSMLLKAEVRDKAFVPAGDAQVQARIVRPDGGSEILAMHADGVTPGSFVAEWNAPVAGSYGAEVTATRGSEILGIDTVPFRRENGVAENFRREQNRELLQRLANDTGAHYYTPPAARHLPREIAYSDAGITGREFMTLWDMPAIFLLLLLLKSSEWLLRRRWGYV